MLVFRRESCPRDFEEEAFEICFRRILLCIGLGAELLCFSLRNQVLRPMAKGKV